jgi:hypothetical protein
LHIIGLILNEFEKYENPSGVRAGIDRRLGEGEEWKSKSLDPKDKWNIIYTKVQYPDELAFSNTSSLQIVN